MIRRLDLQMDVQAAQEQLENPDVWNLHDGRRQEYAHKGVDDIWARFRDLSGWDGDMKTVNDPHVSVWYPVIAKVPAIWSLARRVYRAVGGVELGGVLVTRIPAGGRVEPHVDNGWHARYYEKFAVQIKGDEKQAFHFEGSHLSPNDGDVYTFDNSKLHWVTNDSERERITLITCIRRA